MMVGSEAEDVWTCSDLESVADSRCFSGDNERAALRRGED